MAEVIRETRYECDECGLFWEREDDAATCCPRVAREITTYACAKCGSVYREVNDAATCCPDEEEDEEED